jgi:precorrin-4/cobalt-precorrin-4 C11-methyltransferase
MNRGQATAQVTIAGIGPGSTRSLLTLATAEAIERAALVIYPGVMIGEEIRALVRGRLLCGRGFTDASIRAAISEAVSAGERVAWLEPGDPSLYSGEPGAFGSLSENLAWLRAEGIAYEVLPGVSSLHALTARLGLEHAGPANGCPLIVYAPGRDRPEVARARLAALCAVGAPMALFLAIEMLADIVEIATPCFGAEGRIVLGYRVLWPDEKIIDSTLGAVLTLTDGSELQRHCLVLLGPWQG